MIPVSAILGCIWIILVSAVALMPFPQHKPYAIAMLWLFPVLLIFIAVDFGVVWAVLFLICALSIYRYPALYLLKLARRRFGWAKHPGTRGQDDAA